jgi:hypothetical protein
MELNALHELRRAGWRLRALNPGEREHPVFECVLRDPRTRHEPRHLIAKCYADPALGERTFALMRTLERRVAAHRPGGPLALPRAVSYTAANGLLLQERIAGIPYADLLKRAAAGRQPKSDQQRTPAERSRA